MKSCDSVVCTSSAQGKVLGGGVIELLLTNTQGTHRWRCPHTDLSGGQGTGEPSDNRISLFYFPKYRHCSHELKRRLLLGRKVMTNLDSMLKSRHFFANKEMVCSCQGYGFSSGHVWMWELDGEECWVLKNWCFWTVVLEKTLSVPWTARRSKTVYPKGDQSWVFTGRTDAEVEVPIFGHFVG